MVILQPNLPDYLSEFCYCCSSSSLYTTVWPAAAGRNICAGLAVMALAFDGQRRALGMLIMCWSFAGIADISILARHPRSENKAFTFGLVVWLLFTGAGLIYT